MARDYGFPATRRRGRQRPLSVYFWLAVLAALLLTAGATRAWPQSSGSSSSSSSDDLKTWEALSEKFVTGLNEQSEQLRQALTETETSKASSGKLTRLLERSLQANSNLRSYNAQIAGRMQERNEELARSYEKAGRLEKRVLRLVIALVAASASLAVMIILMVKRR